MKKHTLQSELFQKGLVEKADHQAIKAFKTHRKKTKAKEYNAEYLKDKKVKNLVFTKSEYQKLKTLATEAQMPEATFLKSCIFGYINEIYIAPSSESVKELTAHVLSIKSSISQAIQYVHSNGEITFDDICRIQKQIDDLSSILSYKLSSPPSLSSWLTQQIALNKDHDFLSRLLITIAHHLNTKP